MAGHNALPLVRVGASSCSAAASARGASASATWASSCIGERMMDILESNRQQRTKMLELQEREHILLQNITSVFSSRARAHQPEAAQAQLLDRAEKRKRRHHKKPKRDHGREHDHGHGKDSSRSRECSRADLEESLGDLEEEFAFDADAGPSYAAPRLGVQGVRAAANTFAEE